MEDNGISLLIYLLAIEPESCPCSDEIHFGNLPEWDLLLVFLKRRNVLNTNSHVSPISRVTFPIAPPPVVLRPLCQLLKGKWPDMPPLRDVSLAGNAEIIPDREIPGCLKCHRALKICGLRPLVLYSETEDPEMTYRSRSPVTVPIPSGILEYPETEDEILSTWKSRASLWRELHDQYGLPRPIACARHLGRSPRFALET
ncbi:hypothetical protein CPB86DRAFT_713410 [Serendipita vermifera]|nr:hypothetical protein CPB86DRAFT_713410 [Serendipita vermifera]